MIRDSYFIRWQIINKYSVIFNIFSFNSIHADHLQLRVFLSQKMGKYHVFQVQLSKITE